jgi:hypothetical protein
MNIIFTLSKIQYRYGTVRTSWDPPSLNADQDLDPGILLNRIRIQTFAESGSHPDRVQTNSFHDENNKKNTVERVFEGKCHIFLLNPPNMVFMLYREVFHIWEPSFGLPRSGYNGSTESGSNPDPQYR